jgi:Flp pilus assembly protein TadB
VGWNYPRMSHRATELRSARLTARPTSSRQLAALGRAAVRDLRLALLAAACCAVVFAVVLAAAALRVGSWVPVLAGGAVVLGGLALATVVSRGARQGRVR